MSTRNEHHSDTPDPEQRPRLVELQPETTAVVRGAVPLGDLRTFFDEAFGALGRVLQRQQVPPRSAAFGLSHGVPGRRSTWRSDSSRTGRSAPRTESSPARSPAGGSPA
ncbi:hypothetical protein O1L60_36790 [Streptomyces diastatochromogenes]|nr:hypothetical protein [Streptomyces diastatochromogenes]